MDKLIRAFWYMSVFIVFMGLLYSFAGLPETVTYFEGHESISRDTYFYIALVILAISNFAIYTIAFRLGKKGDFETIAGKISTWLYSINSSFNLFYFVGLMFVMMHNGNEKWNFQLLGIGIYISIGIIVLCLLSLPILLFTKRNNL